ncbi:MAG: transporter [Glaciihabitans sp.]|nr:transporter [Glaciihabitans sp.]
MSILTPVAGTQAIYRVNPVAKFATAMVISVGLLLSVDWVSASVALAFEAVLFFWAGIGPRRFVARTWPIFIAAAFAGVTIALYATASGQTYAQFLFAHVTEGSVNLAIATALRVLAIALPAVVLFLTIDPTDLADGLGQVVRLPSRFVIGALGALRLIGLFAQDWRALEHARRARGVADRGRVRRFAGQAFALLVLSIRRGSKLATAMEARGFGGTTKRTWARASVIGAPEVALVLIGVAVTGIAIATSVLTGHWNFLATR